ncbi:M20/M25/M40 family metallo-hydrolase [Hymenobacter ginsengisoli]|uniref:M20/M25/M40 family metallo-hydrolase n=1 Tax=Hymenobacter ginsengisoli TaxID=1051626 RepID=A0ABP8QLE1_9BACT|nr:MULTISPECIES: M28 family peptidase [unclassified Hymenobacter]MBO2031179.1 M28 family peptidase [Hymenobacter sp. BT559]
MKYASLVGLAAGLLFAQSAPAQSIDPAALAVLPTVQPAALEAHVRYLADDRLRGRLPGTPGYQLAVDYVIGQLKQNGVQPAGDKGTYTQTVRLRRAFVEPGASASLQPASGAAQPLAVGAAVTFYPNPGQAETSVANAPLVFAGYGISAPELKYDDYAGLDAKGKVVVITRQAPKQFADNERQYFADLRTVLETAARHGAVGVLLAAAHAAARLPEYPKGLVSALAPDGRVGVSRSYAPGSAQLVGTISPATLQQLFAGASRDTGQVLSALRGGQAVPLALPGKLSARYRSRYQDVDSYNVVGKITGSDAKLKDEYVVHSAHLDHLGVGPAINGDSIFNGAHDNATGVASVLEISKLYSKLKVKPRRSVLFVLMTGEEMGLIGSSYFAKYPTVPKSALVADINTDMPTIIAPLLAVVPLGADHSSLMQPVRAAADYLKLSIEPDPEPTQNRFIRSDQYSFVVQGVPALHIKYGNRTVDGKNNLSETVQKWRAATYHKQQDNFEGGTFDWQAGAQYARLNFLIGYQVAQASQRPSWNKGDFFGVRFGK